jgi:hypothetical protein
VTVNRLVIDTTKGMFHIKTRVSPATVMIQVLQIHSLIYYRRYIISAIYSLLKRNQCEECTRSYRVLWFYFISTYVCMCVRVCVCVCVCVCEIWCLSKFWRHHSHPNERSNRKMQNYLRKRFVICASRWLLEKTYKFFSKFKCGSILRTVDGIVMGVKEVTVIVWNLFQLVLYRT